jgi:hypothetical protein
MQQTVPVMDPGYLRWTINYINVLQNINYLVCFVFGTQFDTIKLHTPAVKKLENVNYFNDMAKYSYWESIDSCFPLHDLRDLRHRIVI